MYSHSLVPFYYHSLTLLLSILMKKSEKYWLIFEEKITEKRRNTNPYITKVENDPDIWLDEEKIFSQSWAWKDYFENNNEIILEIWTWLWNFFSDEVANNKDKNFLWVEIKYKRLFSSAEKCRKKLSINKKNKNNFLLLKTKWENIAKFLGVSEISKTYVFFPDPWWKKDRQKKHRIFQEKFIKDLYKKTKKGWKLIFKTDHREYFDTTLELFKKIWLWREILRSYDYEADNIDYDKSKKTEFETIFNEKKVCYVEFKKD